MSEQDVETISVEGLGEVPAPGLIGRSEMRVPRECPVPECDARFGSKPTFSQMAGHFGRVTSEDGPLAKAHREFDLQKSHYD